MRQPAFRKARRGTQVSTVATIPAPVKGLNARDSVANMEPLFALEMENYFPETTDVRVRGGLSNHVTGVGQQIESLMPYNATDGTQTLFAAANDSFYNVTSAGAVGAAVQGSLTNARWQSINFTVSDGTSYLLCFNGVDGPRYWNGSAWTTITGSSTPAITGSVTPANIISATVFARRVWLVEVNTLDVHYLPVDSVGGAAKKLPLSGYFSRGGFIQAMESWTLDAGEGADDYLAIITSEGQVAVFKGIDPSSISTFELAGVWNISEPIGRRCMIKYRGDCLIICTDGVYSLSAALQTAQTAPQASLSYNIEDIISDSTKTYKANYGWQIIHFTTQHQIILNVPVLEGSKQIQYAMNTISGAWCKYEGIQVNCWAMLNEEMYCGGNGTVSKFWSADTYSDQGNDIEATLKTAFATWANGRYINVKSVRPNLRVSAAPTYFIGVDTDFKDEEPTGTYRQAAAIANGVWDTSVWDGANWAGGLVSIYDWVTVAGSGVWHSIKVKSSTQVELRNECFDILYEVGGIIN